MASPSPVPPKPPHSGASKPSSRWSAYVLVALLTAAITGAGAFILKRPQPQPIVVHPPPTPVFTPTPAPTDTPAPIMVFVSGAVQSPGLYSLPPEVRVADALDAAGGFADSADADAVNQAERLWDGAQIHVPAMEELSAHPPAGVSGTTRSGGVAIDVLGRVLVNSAAQEELERLPGIGPSKAQAIIDGRPYVSIEDLERVDGIGPKTIEQLRDLVAVE